MERRGAAALDTVGGWGGGRGRRCEGRGGVGRGGERGRKDVDDFGGEVDSGFSPGMFFLSFFLVISLAPLTRWTGRQGDIDEYRTFRSMWFNSVRRAFTFTR